MNDKITSGKHHNNQAHPGVYYHAVITTDTIPDQMAKTRILFHRLDYFERLRQ